MTVTPPSLDPAWLFGGAHPAVTTAPTVFTEPDTASGHAVAADQLAAMYGQGAESRIPAQVAVDRARELAGPEGNVLVCGSLYLVGEILAQLKSAER